jgi:nucleotidyltransferase substrate binding protein (TIGR01987 family)
MFTGMKGFFLKKNEISVEPLKKALSSLELAIQQPLNEFTRDSVIQRFEFTFELCWKILLKFIESDHPLEDRSVKAIFREADSMGFIRNIDQWFKFQAARNLTSHTYNQKTAQEVYTEALKLPAETHHLLSKLK